MNSIKRNICVTMAVMIVAGYGLYRYVSFNPSAPSGTAEATNGVHRTVPGFNGVVSSSGVISETRASASKNGTTSSQGTAATWVEKVVSRAEIKAHPRFWMLAYTPAEKAWLDQYGYPSLAHEAKLSAASLEELHTLWRSGDPNAQVHLGVRYAQTAMQSGNDADFSQGMGFMMGSIIEGGPYQAAKVMSFFAEMSKNHAAYGELEASRKKGLEERLLQTYDLARGISIAHGDYAAYQLGRDVSDNVRTKFNLAPQVKDATFESAMDRLSKLNETRNTNGLPSFSFNRRPPKPFVAEETPTQSVTIYMK
jgi:hypothetical protein